ncbi:MAG: hypothetical protein VR64_19700 [Desulfatitalea sp. BRH_c12]|nr:MAG: hypothetical protein VR64_25220 [Desulfatitalea sp. BRH_c12]KJS29593.1 MAG: hypothetical protein VR64_19700 [Desulfatitalea sp. BRH_c12]
MNRASSLLLLTVLLILILGVSGCAGQRIAGPVSSQHGAIIGNIQAPDIWDLILYELDKVYVTPFAKPPYAYIDKKGNFIFINLTPGQYYLSHWTGGRGGRTTYKISLGKEIVDQLLTEVKAGEIAYTGSFTAKVTRKAFIVPGKFEFDRVSEPSEKEILSDLLTLTKGTGWDAMIEARLKEIDKRPPASATK